MSDRPPRETIPQYLRNFDTRIERLEHLPQGNGLPAGGGAGQVLGFDEEGNATWTDLWPPGGELDDVLTQVIDITTGQPTPGWGGPVWWAWWGTEEQYNNLGSWDDRVLYVIVTGEAGAVTTVTPGDVAHTP